MKLALLEVFIIFILNDVVKQLLDEKNKKTTLDLKNELMSFKQNKNILIIGTGGSYVSGVFAKSIIEKNMKNLCEIKMPMDFLNINLELFSYAIIFSYKMRSYEINKIIEILIDKKYIEKIIIFTSSTSNKYINEKIKYIVYDPDNFEKSYVSFKGIYYPSYLLENCFENNYIDLNKIENEKIDYTDDNIIDVFYDSSNYFLAVLIERHLCELGIATVRLHEKKDFSHGRMSIVERSDVIYIRSSNYEAEYDNILISYLKEVKKCKILNFGLNNEIAYSPMENLLIWLKWLYELSTYRNIDLYLKKDTKDDEKLFKYKEEV